MDLSTVRSASIAAMIGTISHAVSNYVDLQLSIRILNSDGLVGCLINLSGPDVWART